MSDQAFMSALDRIDAEVSKTAAKEVDGESLCATYRKIRAFLEQVIPFVKLIPVWGGKLAAALTFLMSLADTVCPA